MSRRYNAALYLRLSIEDAVNASKRGKGNPFQNESISINNQRTLLTEYATIHGWNIIRVYSDDGYSGGNFDNRPAFQQMLRDAEARLIDLILVKDAYVKLRIKFNCKLFVNNGLDKNIQGPARLVLTMSE